MEEQCLQLSTPSYRLKKEKKNLRNLMILPVPDSSSLIDQSLVRVQVQRRKRLTLQINRKVILLNVTASLRVFPEFRLIFGHLYVYLTGCKILLASVNVWEKRGGNGHFVHCLKSF